MEIGNVFLRMISPQKAHENKDWHDIRWKLAVLIYITVGEKERYEPHTNYEGFFGFPKIIGIETYLLENFSQEKAPENSRWPFLGSKSVKNG